MIFFKKRTPSAIQIGQYGEDIAADHLKKQGLRIVCRNFRAGKNEIDIIAEDRNFIVFAEVKTRSGVGTYEYDYGTPATAVTHAKRKRIIEAARAYLYKRPTEKMPRFDVVEIYLSKTAFSEKPQVIKIEHLTDAFRN